MTNLAAPAQTLIHRPASYFSPLQLEALFNTPQPLEVELGSGDGSFLLHYAIAHPERNFIGVERLLGRLRKLDKKSLRANLRNVALLRIEAGYFLEYLLPAHSTSALHLYFPDPWPKRRHRKNRLVNERFPQLARRVLTSAGTVYLRTDDLDYFEQMQEVFAAAGDAYTPLHTPSELASVHTDFERQFLAQGKPSHLAAFQVRD